MKKRMGAMVLCVSLVLCIATTALAANPAFDFNLTQIGTRNVKVDVSSANNKVYINDGWTIHLTSLACDTGHAGVAFMPVLYVGAPNDYWVSETAWIVDANYRWLKAPTSTTGTYKSNVQTGNHAMAARNDDQNSTNALAKGTWNADT